jgi:hypothetical protein
MSAFVQWRLRIIMEPGKRLHPARSLWWGAALLAVGLLLVSGAPAIVGLIGVVVLAIVWSWHLEHQHSGAAVPRGAIGDDRDLHVAGERHDALDQTPTKKS